jgi:hypothetical protein
MRDHVGSDSSWISNEWHRAIVTVAMITAIAFAVAGCGGGSGGGGAGGAGGSGDTGGTGAAGGTGGGGGTGAGGGCSPICAAKQCGDDGCGGSCGTCTSPQTCSAGGSCVGGTAASLDAEAVGAYTQAGTTCASGTPLNGTAMFVCPGKRIRGAGYVGNVTDLLCGTYTTTQPSMQNCTDKVGCYPKAHVSAKDTLTLGGQRDVADIQFDMLMTNGLQGALVGKDYLWRAASCNDKTTGYIVLKRIAVDVSDDYCVSAACPAPSGGTAGTCGTDCDCGHCWYCDKSGGTGTCRYGGEGPYGCYRGCG